jgi:ribosome-associated protein
MWFGRTANLGAAETLLTGYIDGCAANAQRPRKVQEQTVAAVQKAAGPRRLTIDAAVQTPRDRALELALAAARVADENRGRDIVILDLRELTPLFDYFVIATGTSRRQLHAISEEIDKALEQGLGDRRMGIEGYVASRWILLDYGNVVIHLFDLETREYYALENLWGGAKHIEWTRPRRDTGTY